MIDFINILYVLIVLMIINKYYNIKKLYLFLLLLHLPMIFLFNGFLFNPEFMPDQFKYLDVAKNIRSFDFLNESNFSSGRTVLSAGIFFAVFPIPFIDSIFSIAIINYLLYLSIFVFMYKKGFLESKAIAYFYLCYPSMILYSSVALRDMLIFTIMFLGIYLLVIRKSIILSFCVMFSLVLIKFQNLLIISVGFIINTFLSKGVSKKSLFISLLCFLVVFLNFSEFFSLDMLNIYRLRFYNENISDINEPFSKIDSYVDIILYAIPSAISFFLRPFPWHEFGLFQIIQFLENLILLLIIIYIWVQNSKFKLWKLEETRLLMFVLFIALVVYGLVTFNSATAARYKFPFVTVYIIYSLFFIYKAKQFSKKSNLCVE